MTVGGRGREADVDARARAQLANAGARADRAKRSGRGAAAERSEKRRATPTGFEPRTSIATRRTISTASHDHAWLPGSLIPSGHCPSSPALTSWPTAWPTAARVARLHDFVGRVHLHVAISGPKIKVARAGHDRRVVDHGRHNVHASDHTQPRAQRRRGSWLLLRRLRGTCAVPPSTPQWREHPRPRTGSAITVLVVPEGRHAAVSRVAGPEQALAGDYLGDLHRGLPDRASKKVISAVSGCPSYRVTAHGPRPLSRAWPSGPDRPSRAVA